MVRNAVEGVPADGPRRTRRDATPCRARPLLVRVRAGIRRVAASTIVTSIGDPARNVAQVLELGQRCDADDVALAVFPELALSGYSIEDVVLQDLLLDAVEEAVRNARARPRPSSARCSSSAPRCAFATASTTRPSSSTAAGCSAWCPSPTCRTTASSTSGANSRPGTASGGSARSTVSAANRSRSVPTCCSRADDLAGLVVHVEICEDLWVPMPPSAEAALAGATVLANLSGSNDHRRQGRDAAAAVPVGSRRAASPPTSTPRPARGSRRPTWPGTARR